MNPLYVVGGILILATLAQAARIVRMRARRRDEEAPPVLVFSAKAAVPGALPVPAPPLAHPNRTESGTAAPARPEQFEHGSSPHSPPTERVLQAAPFRRPEPVFGPPSLRSEPEPYPPDHPFREGGEDPTEAPPPVRSVPRRVPAAGGVGSGGTRSPALTHSDGRAVARVEPGPDPGEGTLQLLPGRIRVVTGENANEEIRFVRVPGAPPEVTFGRTSGPAHRHVQLDSPTVSRLHARLRYENGGWILSNLSRTNPTRLNGRPLSSDRGEERVRDGDRIELGEVVLEFHQPEVQDRLPLRSSWASEIGLRSANQDAVAVRKLPGRREVAAVCDGMGSHRAGAQASHLALDALVRTLMEGGALTAAFQAANAAVHREARADASKNGMGTTMVALLAEDDTYWIGNVGDSRAYRIDAERIDQLTRDHSFVAEAVQAGEMSAAEAARSPWRNAITRNLGASPEVEVDLFGAFSARDPHIVVLCSDGLHGVLEAEDIERTVREISDIRDVARALCDEAIRRGSRDNVTVAALAFSGGLVGRGPT